MVYRRREFVNEKLIPTFCVDGACHMILQASIDLRKDALIINNSEIPFLSEHELPEKQRLIEVRSQSRDGKPNLDFRSLTPFTLPAQVHGGPDPEELPGSSSSSSSSSAAPPPPSSTTPYSPPITISPPNPAREPPVPAVAAVPVPPAPSSYPEETIQFLINLGGISRQEAVQALEIAGGNADLAASLLFQG